MSKIYACRKSISFFQKYMHVRNILIHVKIICMYFQKHKTTKSGVQIFLVCVVLNKIFILTSQKSSNSILSTEAAVPMCS